ncbi:hypothetical protein D9757_002296 [Collybiopsis confluens]|uniref:Methyltransferase domain-containing protein n=1 Tax=Collybiopsis confluens TaxID=2823264 RepID=A0A8H5HZH9_9AGAR|nr:hypothetical protein D9757_002296 [Collybiopsis confluens]
MAISAMSNGDGFDDKLPEPARTPSPIKSHYRPFSTLISPPDPPHSRRPLSSVFAMGFFKPNKPSNGKGKEKEKEETETPIAPKDSFIHRTLRPKKSLNALFVRSEQNSPLPPAPLTPSLAVTFVEAPFDPSTTPPTSSPNPSSSFTFIPQASSSSSVSDEFDYDEPDKFEVKDTWNTRGRRLKLHPYGSHAPYMQSYDPVALSVDRYTHKLLTRLNPTRTPAFYDYAKHKKPPPTSILDLGCGEGHWILDCANQWPDARIVGLDIVDVSLPEIHGNDRMSVIRGNFVRYPLPFPRDSFDLVRIANLSLAIPADRWDYVLSEVYRVLRAGGRIELIDDSIYFPYGKQQPSTSYPRMRSNTCKDSADTRESSSLDLFDDEDDEDMTLFDDGEIDSEQSGQTQTGLFWVDAEPATEEIEQGSNGERTFGTPDDPYLECPSSPETAGDGIFLDTEDSKSSASSLQEPEDCDESSLSNFPQSRALPPAPMPPHIPLSLGPDLTLVTGTVTKKDDDDIVTPTKPAILSPTPASVLNLETSSSAVSDRGELSNGLQEPVPMVSDESDWSARAKDNQKLEEIFHDMLENKYGVLTRTPKAISDLLKNTFGSENVRKLRSMHLTLAPPELEEFIPTKKRSKFRVRSLSKAPEFGSHVGVDEDFGAAKKLEMASKKAKGKEHSVPFPSKEFSSSRSRLEARHSSDSTTTPNTLSAKAAVRLGITYSALAVATKSAQSSPAMTPALTPSPAVSLYSTDSSSAASVARISGESHRASSEIHTSFELFEPPVPLEQSPGLLLLPSTFLPMHPVELEMHACKHMHTLLSCKHAISDWLMFNDDGTESDLVSEEALQDSFFEYDTFRRRRLNWPSSIPDTTSKDYIYKKNVEIPFQVPPKSASSVNSMFSADSHYPDASNMPNIGPYKRHDLTDVRTIRIYLALKADSKPGRI